MIKYYYEFSTVDSNRWIAEQMYLSIWNNDVNII